LLRALADGLTQKQVCLASGISESTLSNWKEHPELEERLASAGEQARQKALARIRAAGEAGRGEPQKPFFGCRSLRITRRGDINVSATAVTDNRQVVVTEETEKDYKRS
jgi:hypothetical protein